MPTPLDILLDPAALVTMGLFAALMLWEALAPARPLPAVHAWRIKGIASLLVYLMIASYLPLLWDEHLARWQLVDLTHLPVWAGAIVGFLVYEIVGYAYHRALHRFTPMWRVLHQMHHSSERLDVASAFWFSPLDIAGWTLVTSLALVLGVGLAPEAAKVTLFAITYLSIFTHANIRTPRWLGYLIVRPESHALHHARGVHGHNYCEVPLIDMLFGTFRNPRGFPEATGFWDGASSRVIDMLRFADVSEPHVDKCAAKLARA
jgi:sterol desaturase/sphingolipid hydroxylase (fatty acid hydroxylase superfamily)